MRSRLRLCVLTSLPLWIAGHAAADTLATGAPATALDIDDQFASGAMLQGPTGAAFTPDGRMVITRRTGQVVVRTAAGMLVQAGAFAVNSGPAEQGLLGVAVHPDFATNKRLFFYYSATDANGGSNMNRHRVVSVVLSDANMIDTANQTIIVQNLRGQNNHNGGALAILGDKLFIGVGDTGCNSNVRPSTSSAIGNYFGTCLTNPNGKVLRVNLDGSIPMDNPLVGQTVTACAAAGTDCGTNGDQRVAPSGTSTMPRTDIWAWGMRNPFRIWPDPKTGNVWVGDVGEIAYEEVNIIPKAGGKHFGWPWREGNEGRAKSECSKTMPGAGECVDPVYFCETNQAGGNNAAVPNGCDSITGGIILDDCRWPAEFEGRYVFGDYQNDGVWTLQVNAARDNVMGARADFATVDGGPVQFIEHNGALYIVAFGNYITEVKPKTPDVCPGTGMGGGGAGGGSATAGAAGKAGGAATGGAPAAGTGGSSPNGGTAPVAGSTSGGSTAGGAPPGQSGAPGTSGSPATAGSSTSGGGPSLAGAASSGAPAGGQSNSAGAPPGTAGAAGGGDGGSDDGGCGCRVAGGSTGALAAMLGVLAGAATLVRRRSRKRRDAEASRPSQRAETDD